MKASCGYTEKEVEETRQWVVLQLGGWAWGYNNNSL
jgi:hypothetical protein